MSTKAGAALLLDGRIDDDPTLALIHEALLHRYDHYDEAMSAESEPPAAYWLMTVSCGQHISKAYLEWCDETIAKLERLPPEPRAGAEHWTPPDHSHLEEGA